jgi:B-box zinc finger
MLESEGLTECPNDNEPIVERSADECRKNQKIINFINSEEAVPLLFGNFESIPCPKHPHKMIEYFCKTCSIQVCVKCIYDDHNGHQLMQVEEMGKSNFKPFANPYATMYSQLC